MSMSGIFSVGSGAGMFVSSSLSVAVGVVVEF